MLKIYNKSIPLISILIANYNNRKRVKRAIKSCLKQNYKNIEIIVFDDCSTDGSQNTIKKIKKIKKIFNKKKKYISYQDSMNAYLKMFKLSKGKFIFLLDSDDFFFPKKISTLVNFYLKNPKIKFIQDAPRILSKQRTLIKNKNFIFSRWPHFSPTSCLSIERNFFKQFIKYDNFLKYKFVNVWLDFRLCAYSFFKRKNFFFYNFPLTNYDQTQSSNQSNSYFKFKSNWILRRYFSHLYINDFYKDRFILNIDFIFTKFVYKIFYEK
jgi:glycosyltransferase involved in cell wall biosynthesis